MTETSLLHHWDLWILLREELYLTWDLTYSKMNMYILTDHCVAQYFSLFVFSVLFSVLSYFYSTAVIDISLQLAASLIEIQRHTYIHTYILYARITTCIKVQLFYHYFHYRAITITVTLVVEDSVTVHCMQFITYLSSIMPITTYNNNVQSKSGR